MNTYKQSLLTTIILSAISVNTSVSADNTTDSDRLFNWAEINFSQLFSPSGQISGIFEQYYYRYYPDTNIYLATSGNNVHYYRPDIDVNVQAAGIISDYIVISDNGTAVTAGSTDGVLCNYNDTTDNSQASLTYTSISEWVCTDTTRELTANGIPDHEVGTFPNANNPNTISEQTVSASYLLEPTLTTTATTLGGPSGATGYVLNGVKIDANTAGSCDDSGTACSLIDNSGNWSIEALGQTSFNFGTDDNNAHVQPDGSYHYHGMPEGFITKQGGNNSTMTLIGWAADGFPIYARYGYSIADDASSAIESITSSYQLVNNLSSSRPSTGDYPLGTFKQDWEYVAGLGDLDECNGRVGVTPEFPEGTYHYYATDSYPYLQRCIKGAVDAGLDDLPPTDNRPPRNN